MSVRDERNLLDELLARAHGLPREIEPPTDLWRDVAAQLRPGTAPRPIPRPDRAWGFPPRFASWTVQPALAAALVLAIGATLWLRARDRPGWRVEAVTGQPALAASAIETDHGSSVRLAVGRIGQVNVEPDSRVRLLTARRAEHRLALDRGTIEARISAPPRLFYVETPSATAVDLGCAYTLMVDARGGSLIHVSVGWVELGRFGRTSVVPFNMSAYTQPGFAPGTPFSDRASDSLKVALLRFDFERGGDSALGAVLANAREQDAITLWHLLARTDGASRAAVYRRLAGLVPPPEGVTQQAVLRLERRALGKWWDALPGSPGTMPWWQRLAVRISAWLGAL
jgi:hypothetical protein